MENKEYYTLEEIEDKYIGVKGTPKRDAYEADIKASNFYPAGVKSSRFFM